MKESMYDLAKFGEFEKLRKLAASDPQSVNQTDEFGFTPLHGLATEEHFGIAEFLIQHGANVNARNNEGITPLHLAAWPEMAQLLIRHGADLEVRSNIGETPLLVLAAEQEREDVIETLLEAGADINANDRSGMTALDIALSREEDDKVRLLQKYGAKEAK